MSHNYPTSRATQQGVVLLESLIAILLFSMGILALVGLQGAMVKNTSDSKYRSDAAFIAQQKLGEVWVNAKNLPTLAGYIGVDDVSAIIPAGSREVAISAEGLVTVTVSWKQPGQDSHKYSTNARIEGL